MMARVVVFERAREQTKDFSKPYTKGEDEAINEFNYLAPIFLYAQEYGEVREK